MDYDFWIEIWRNYGHIWNQLPQICHNAGFHVKQKNFELETKNILLGEKLRSISSYSVRMRESSAPVSEILPRET